MIAPPQYEKKNNNDCAGGFASIRQSTLAGETQYGAVACEIIDRRRKLQWLFPKTLASGEMKDEDEG
jgi:hypothetical protein